MNDKVEVQCPSCGVRRSVKAKTKQTYISSKRSFKCRSCYKEQHRNSGIEVTKSGVKINWDYREEAINSSAKKNFQRTLLVSCIDCNNWRKMNSCTLADLRNGNKKRCWECHKKDLAKRNSTGVSGRHKNTNGYIIRSTASFTKEEMVIIKPMMRSSCKSKRSNRTEVLEHRAIMALHLGRPLTGKEIVHHINGIKDDNRIENLELLENGTHGKTHAVMLEENTLLKKRIRELEQILGLEK